MAIKCPKCGSEKTMQSKYGSLYACDDCQWKFRPTLEELAKEKKK